MIERMIEIEADTLEEAREQIRSQIPQGLYLLSEHIIADGSPVTTTKELIEIEADTLEEAREQAKSQIPEGHHLLSEQIISDGKPGTVRAFGGTKEAALAKAQGEIPKGASILEIEETPPVRKVIVIAAATEREATLDAMREAHSQFGLDFGVSGNATLKDARLLAVAKKGFFGVGARPAQYEVELLQQPAVCITYKPKAKISCLATRHGLICDQQNPICRVGGFEASLGDPDSEVPNDAQPATLLVHSRPAACPIRRT